MPDSPARQGGLPPVVSQLWIPIQFSSLPVPLFLVEVGDDRGRLSDSKDPSPPLRAHLSGFGSIAG